METLPNDTGLVNGGSTGASATAGGDLRTVVVRIGAEYLMAASDGLVALGDEGEARMFSNVREAIAYMALKGMKLGQLRAAVIEVVGDTGQVVSGDSSTKRPYRRRLTTPAGNGEPTPADPN